MATELVIVHHCDICLADGTKSPAVFTVSMGAEERGDTLTLEACEQHARPLQTAWSMVVRYGATPDGATLKPRHSVNSDPQLCPRCGKSYPTRGSLRSHLRNVHHLTAGETNGLLPPPGNQAALMETPCPVCEFVAGNRVGLLSHVRTTHPEQYQALRNSGAQESAGVRT